MIKDKLEDYVRTIPDFPEKGIMFRDITSVLQDPDGLKMAIDGMQDKLKDCDFDVIAGKRDQFLGKLQERQGLAVEAAEEQLSAWQKRHPDFRFES